MELEKYGKGPPKDTAERKVFLIDVSITFTADSQVYSLNLKQRVAFWKNLISSQNLKSSVNGIKTSVNGIKIAP